jgi:hypothetical protein
MPQIFVPFSFILITIRPYMNTKSLCSAIYPLAYVRFYSIWPFPNTISLFYSITPFTIVYFSILPSVNTLFVWFSVTILALVRIKVRKKFISASRSHILLPLTFIHSAIFINANPKTMSFLVFINLTLINAVFILFYQKVLCLFYSLVVKLVWYHSVFFDWIRLILKF